MDMQELLNFLKRKWQTIVVFMLAAAVLAFLFSIVQPQNYRADQRFLVVEKYAENVDPYAATQSTQYLTDLLSQVMYSQSFMNQVLSAGYGIDKSSFPSEPQELQKAWQKALSTRVVGDTGILEVSVYFNDRYKTEQLALAVGQVLRTDNGQYHGHGNDVTIQTIDQPITSLYPVEPNLALNTGIGALVGLVIALGFVYLFPKREIHFRRLRASYRLLDRGSQDWSKPLATPKSFSRLSELSDVEIKLPLGAGKRVEPPANLPIG